MLVEFSELNIKLLILLIFPIFNMLQDYSKKAYLEKDNPMFKSFRYFLSYILAGIFLIIFKLRNKSSSSKKQQIIDDKEKDKDIVSSLIIKNKKKKSIKSYLLLALLCAIGMFCQFYRKIFEKDEYFYGKLSIEVFFYIIFLAIFSYFFLGQKLYKHHFFAIGIIIFILLILFIISIPFMEEYFGTFIYFLFYSALFCIYDILKKKHMNIYFSTPYFMMLIIGVVDTILLLIFDIIAYYANPDISGIIIGFDVNINKTKDFFIFILDIILIFLWNFGIWLTIFFFSPCHEFISEFIIQFILFIQNASEGEDKFYTTTNIIMFVIGYFIIFCFILIFNEVVILNFCGMEHNTKKRILQREIKDSDFTNMIDLHCSTKDEEDDDDISKNQ